MQGKDAGGGWGPGRVLTFPLGGFVWEMIALKPTLLKLCLLLLARCLWAL